MGSDHFWLYDALAFAGIILLAAVLGLRLDRKERQGRRAGVRPPGGQRPAREALLPRPQAPGEFREVP